jgi:murein L,D-transpeptidase YafK
MRLHVFLLLALLGAISVSGAAQADGTRIDKVLILKQERRLKVISGGEIIRTYRVALGRQPVGHKQEVGDQRTPEGIYTIDWRHKSADFNLSMHLDYPNLKDKTAAYTREVDPGGMIMIHGTPIDEEYPEWYFEGLDWTNGCIALTNQEMRALWDLVPDGTLVEIKP